jgi:hypothetical protein
MNPLHPKSKRQQITFQGLPQSYVKQPNVPVERLHTTFASKPESRASPLQPGCYATKRKAQNAF